MSVSVFTKTVAELSLISKGQRITARSLNEPRRAINTMLRGMTPPQQVEVPAQPSAGEPAIAVVLVEAPSLPDPPENEGSSILKIRRVKYEAEPPVAEQYAWDGAKFDAYPAFGLTVADFVGLEWTSPAAPEADGATFLKARFVDGFWLVDKPVAGVVVAQFRLIESEPVRGDYLQAEFYSNGEVFGDFVKIAKPYLLRESTFDGQVRRNIRYDAIAGRPGERTATRVGTSETEKQVIVDKYYLGDLIYATAPVKGGTGVSVNGTPLIWLDDNRDGRAFAAEFEEGAA